MHYLKRLAFLSTASPSIAHSVKRRNGRRLGLVLGVLLGVVATGVTSVAYAERSPGGLPATAPEADLKFQPAIRRPTKTPKL